ncbi:MAG: Ig-like domain-containing protein [Syntrophales bacterium]
MIRMLKTVMLLVLIGFTAGCCNDGSSSVSLVSVDVTPSEAEIHVGGSVQFTATGTYNDSSTRNLTSLVNWTSSNALVATVGNSTGSKGLASGVSSGFVLITATSGSIDDYAELEVEAP